MDNIRRKIQINMSTQFGNIVEGVFAINKPHSISSAQVIRDLQRHFNPSRLFRPWIETERTRRGNETRRQGKKSRKRDERVQVKIGHGGTLDPMATGVLIMGVGSGTKALQGFLECTKTYEATILFGAATDTYDNLGKILKRAPYEHLTKRKVEQALEQYRGKIMQRPPLYSALRMEGKRLYEYAREGKAIPKEIEKRPVEVKSIELVEWMEGGRHSERLPQEEAEQEAKGFADKLLGLSRSGAAVRDVRMDKVGKDERAGAKRQHSPSNSDEGGVIVTDPAMKHVKLDSGVIMSGGLQESNAPSLDCYAGRAPVHNSSEAWAGGPPAVRLRMTVTSGFYVRSLSHDLGEAVGTLACMSALVRTRQGSFQLGDNVLEYSDLDKGEDIWAPRVSALLDGWHANK